ncbi:MAG: hypothetical protein CVV21_11390 [Candidatus Goldiibacteriota bacterium HGW-Goldbacteria-1]|nr:MAG: hypothetical protein CVV21_11390 [Candidatus Goldiibacteriota bacterium HGW-Goldbacteria-1]
MRKYSFYILYFFILLLVVISCKRYSNTFSPSQPESTATPAFTATITLTPTPSWKFVAGVFAGGKGLDYTISNGTHYLAAADPDLFDYPSVFKLTGDKFVKQPLIDNSVGSSGVRDINMVVDGNNVYLSYYEYSFSAATVKKFDGNTWSFLGDRVFAKTDIDSSSMDVYQGVPYLAYRDDTNNGKLRVVKFNGSNWEDVGSSGIPDNQVNNVSLQVSNGKIYVSFLEYLTSGISVGKVIKYESGVWQELGSGSISSDLIRILTLFVDGDTPYVAYKDGYGNCYDTTCDGITVKKLFGSTWAMVGDAEFSLGRVDGISLYVYDGVPYVAFIDAKLQSNVTAMKFDGASWVYIGKQAFMNDSSGLPKIFVYDGIPYVAATYKGVSGLMKFSN